MKDLLNGLIELGPLVGIPVMGCLGLILICVVASALSMLFPGVAPLTLCGWYFLISAALTVTMLIYSKLAKK